MKQIAIGTIAKFVNGYPFKPTDWSEAGMPIIRIQNLTDKNKPYNRTSLNVPAKYVVRKGDTLVSWSATIDVFEWNNAENALLNQHIFKVDFDHEKVDKEYFRQVLRHTIDDLTKFSHGSTMKHVVKGDFENHKIPLPDLKTQRQIAHILSRAEELIATRQRSLDLLDDFLKSTFLDLFGDDEKFDHVLLGSLSEGTDGIKCGPFGTQLQASSFLTTGVPLWGIKQVNVGFKIPTHEFISADKANELKTYKLISGDLVMTRKGTVGNCAIYPDHLPEGIMHSDLLRIRLDKSKSNSVFINSQLRYSQYVAQQIKQISGGAIMAGINVTKLKLINVILPPLSLQTQFAEIVNHVETLKTRQRESLAHLQTLYQSLLQRAFAGELDVSGVVLPDEETPLLRRPINLKLAVRKTKLRSAVRYHTAEDPAPISQTETPPLMKLLTLTLNDSFRSLPTGFRISFLPENTPANTLTFAPYCLVGPNGSGKSNVLEVLAAIFYHIDCIYLTSKPDGFDRNDEQPDRGFDAAVCQPDAFELTYLTRVPDFATKKDQANPLWHITIRKEKGSRPVVLGYKYEHPDNGPTSPPRELNRTEVPRVLPDLVVGYSSGENEVLSLPFFKMRFLHYDEYLKRLSEQLDYSKPEGRLIYLDTQFSQAVMLANYLMQPQAVMQPVYDLIGVEGVASFQLHIQRQQYVPLQATGQQLRVANEQFRAIADSGAVPKGAAELTSLLVHPIIDKLSLYATSRVETPEMLTLYFQVDTAMRNAFRRQFNDDPLTLFRAFQSLLTLNLYSVEIATKQAVYKSNSLYVTETVPTLPADKRVATFENLMIRKREEDGFRHEVSTRALSDGEYQFLHSMGICLLLKDTNALFLLDEPETHFNPDWRAQFISTLNQCLQANESGESVGELLITSHSPFIVSDCRPDNVLIFKRGQLQPTRPSFNTFGASVDNITMTVFDKTETIANVADSMLKAWRSEPIENQADIDRLRANTRQLGDSIEKIMFLNYLREQEKKLLVASAK